MPATPGGALQPCERVGQGMPLGTAATGLNPRRIQALRERFTRRLDGRCSDCWAVRLCRICYASTATNGPGDDGLERWCQAVREGLEATIRLRLEEIISDARSPYLTVNE
jgi:uncharacterized protein